LQPQPTDELIAAHVRSMMVSHLTDVASSDKHAVKPWFNGKLDFSPSVLDLQEHGYQLVGGRLDYLQKQPVAALVYKHRAHIINVFIRRVDSAATMPAGYTQQQGYNLIRWRKDGLDYALVSDLNEKELRQMARLLESQLASK
jgi:anti-sigma factor RsiW